MLDVRLMLTLEPRREAIHLEGKLVASHMRLVYSIPKPHVYFRSGYSSEPILSEAAAQQLYVFQKYSQSAMIEILMENVSDGLLDLGARGELIARVLLTSAYDRVVERDHSGPLDTGTIPFFSRGCKVITFIEELFSEAYAKTILDSVPDNVTSHVLFRDAFKSAKMCFTHFAKMVDDTCTTSDAMYAAFLRGIAVICATGQPAVDILIPVLLEDVPLCEEVMTSLMIQIKR